MTYIGITGHKSANRNLQLRYGDYLTEQRRPKRPAIHNMLNRWKDCLYFYFAEVDSDSETLEMLERQLNGAMLPPYSQNDFEAHIRAAKSVWEKM